MGKRAFTSAARLKKVRIVAYCDYCGDPIYNFQDRTNGMHDGCADLKELLTKAPDVTLANGSEIVLADGPDHIKGMDVVDPI